MLYFLFAARLSDGGDPGVRGPHWKRHFDSLQHLRQLRVLYAVLRRLLPEWAGLAGGDVDQLEQHRLPGHRLMRIDLPVVCLSLPDGVSSLHPKRQMPMKMRFIMVKNLLILLSATALVALTTHGRATAQSNAPRPMSQYMAVAWETSGYLVTENWGKSWRLVSSDAVSELPERLVALLKANQSAKHAIASVLPNPTVGPAAIRFSADHAGIVRITLHDMRGSEVLRSTRDVGTGFQTENVDLSSLPNGVYYYPLSTMEVPLVVEQ